MAKAKWRTLYRAGAVAPLIALALYFSQFIIMALGEPFPATAVEWFALFQRNKLLGLWYLNALDIISFTLVGIMFLALYAALRHVSPSWMLIAVYVALLGVVVFVVPRVLTLSMLPLSDLHAAAPTEAEKATYLAAGETLSNVTTATPQTIGFQLTAVAGLIVSAVILPSQNFAGSVTLGRAAGILGIVGFCVALANYVCRIVAPPIAAILMPINGFLWLVWWLTMSIGLFRQSRCASSQEAVSA